MAQIGRFWGLYLWLSSVSLARERTIFSWSSLCFSLWGAVTQTDGSGLLPELWVSHFLSADTVAAGLGWPSWRRMLTVWFCGAPGSPPTALSPEGADEATWFPVWPCCHGQSHTVCGRRVSFQLAPDDCLCSFTVSQRGRSPRLGSDCLHPT